MPVKELLIRHPYINPLEGPRPELDCSADAGVTKQAHKDECDINRIMERFQRRGVLDHVARFEGQYGEFGDSISFHQAQQTLVAAQEAFDTLPAAVRARFKNDPAEFLDFVQDEKNAQEMFELGLRSKPPAPVVDETGAPVEPPAAPADAPAA